MSEDYDRSVFINCPFSSDYAEFLNVYMFAVLYCNFRPRCAREFGNGANYRLENIVKLIAECRYGIHDLSVIELDQGSGLPRLNMAFELGLFIGSIRFGGDSHASKSPLVLDGVEHASKKALSDMAGTDPDYHEHDLQKATTAVRDWLRTSAKADGIPSGKLIFMAYERFVLDLPNLAGKLGLDVDNLIYVDSLMLMNTWLGENRLTPQ